MFYESVAFLLTYSAIVGAVGSIRDMFSSVQKT